VVDAGDDVTLLRLGDESIGAKLTHGQSVDITLLGIGDSDECDRSRSGTELGTEDE